MAGNSSSGVDPEVRMRMLRARGCSFPVHAGMRLDSTLRMSVPCSHSCMHVYMHIYT